jgi:hypothetical protein
MKENLISHIVLGCFALLCFGIAFWKMREPNRKDKYIHRNKDKNKSKKD